VWIGLILAGGLSRRMGRDKAVLVLRGRTLLERAVDLVRAAGGEPVVVGRRRPAGQVAGARQVDEAEGPDGERGPLAALRCGLELAGGRPALALACDLPLLPLDLIGFLMREIRDHDAVVPRCGGLLHVLSAAYAPSCLGAIARHLARGDLSLHGFLDEVRLRIVDEEELEAYGGPGILLNVNTREDLERARRRLAERET